MQKVSFPVWFLYEQSPPPP